MTLSAHALTTVATVLGELGLTSSPALDARIERMIEAVSAAFERLAGGRLFYYEANIVERVRGYGGFVLALNRPPLISISSILLLNIDGTTAETLLSTTYAIETADAGTVFRPGGFFTTAQPGNDIRETLLAGTEARRIQVTYTAGWVTPNQAGSPTPVRTLPYDIEEVIIQSVCRVFQNSGRDINIGSETSAGGSSVSFINDNTLISEGADLLTAAAQRTAKRYWRGWVD